jgi:hypothetical protein
MNLSWFLISTFIEKKIAIFSSLQKYVCNDKNSSKTHLHVNWQNYLFRWHSKAIKLKFLSIYLTLIEVLTVNYDRNWFTKFSSMLSMGKKLLGHVGQGAVVVNVRPVRDVAELVHPVAVHWNVGQEKVFINPDRLRVQILKFRTGLCAVNGDWSILNYIFPLLM